MNNRVLTLLRGARGSAGESQQTVSSPTPELSAELGRWTYPRRTALRPLGWVLLAVVLGLGALLPAHQSSQAQTAQKEGVEAWLPVPYPRNANLTSDPARQFTDAELDAILDKAVSAGADGVEIQADWWILEPAKDQYKWADYTDRFVREARERGLKVGFQITQAPVWARQSGGDYGGWDPPRSSTELAAWSDFISDMVNRYGTQVTRYKMWNEPNLPTFWKPGPNPSEYATLLRTGYLAAKAANPNVTVTCCSLSHNDLGYLDLLYGELRKYPDAAANDDFFDELSVHPYSHRGTTPTAPDAPESTFQHTFGTKNTNFWGYRKLRETMVARGDAHKKIYIGEFGYNTKASWADPITDEQRAVWLKKAFEIANQDGAYLSGLDWYSYYTDVDRGWNLVDPNTLAESATFKALREVAGGARTAETLAFAPVDDARVSRVKPNSRLGSWSRLVADGDPERLTLLKFEVSGVGAKKVQSATLRLRVADDGGSGDGPGLQRAANTWTEKEVTWNNRPALQTPMQDDKGVVPSSSWMTFDVTNLVAADGTVTLAVVPTSGDGTYVYSKEGDVKPELVLALGG